jgi:hypothetical protein
VGGTGENPPSGQEARKSRRQAISARARFREVGANPYEVQIEDLSATGFRMQSYARPRVGTRIWVSLPGLQPLEAVVRRSDGNFHGCEFINPLHPSVAEHLQAQLRR